MILRSVMARLIFIMPALLLHTTILFAQKKERTSIRSKPKLVIGIIVDQMRYDYLDRYKTKFSTDGFMRLVNEGFLCKNANYNYIPTYTAPGHACIYTGATPSVNGIVGNEWFRRKENDTLYCVQDDSASSVGSTTRAGKMSPRNLWTSTITDELKASTNGKTIGISLKDRGAILPAGHKATAAYWYDGKTGNWITSTYYMNDLPGWMKDFNARQLSQKYLSGPWTTLLPIDQYTESTADNTAYEEAYANEEQPVFPHDFPKIKGSNYELVLKSPFGNTLTKELAIAAIKGEELGMDNATDFLAISFSSTDYVGHQFGPNSIETEDTYLRLDNDIAELLKYIDDVFGKDNVLVFLTADHGAVENPLYLNDHKISAGMYKPEEMEAALREGLKYKYGTDGLLLSFMNEQVYLNHDAIAKNNLKLEEVMKSCVAILKGFDDVKKAFTSSDISKPNAGESAETFLYNGYNSLRSGDVMVIFKPNIIEHRKGGTTHGSGYAYDTHVPLLWYGWNIRHGSTDSLVKIIDITPTLSNLLHINIPNKSEGHPIKDLLK